MDIEDLTKLTRLLNKLENDKETNSDEIYYVTKLAMIVENKLKEKWENLARH